MKKYLTRTRRCWPFLALLLWGGYASAQVPPCNPPVPATIQGLSPQYCSTSPAVTLTGNPAGGQFFLDAPNVPPSGGLSGNGVLNPVAFQPGTYTVVYTGVVYPEPGTTGCFYSTTATFTVVASPQLTANVGPAACNTCNNGFVVVQSNTLVGCLYTLTTANGQNLTSQSGEFGGLLPGTYVINAQCPGGCSNQITVTVGVSNNDGEASFTGLQPHYCVGEVNILPMFQLTGNPPGGTFTMTPPQPDGSPGITPDGWFYPYGWAPGTYTVTYTVNVGGVTYSTSQTTVVGEAPQAQILPNGFEIGQTLCPNGQFYGLIGVPGGGTFQGPGIVASNPGTAYFDPGQIPPGAHVFTYSGMAENGCEFHAQITVNIGALQLSIQNITHPTCNNCTDGQFIIGVNGGSAPYMFTLTGPDGQGFTQSQPFFGGLAPGVYIVHVQSADGCTGTINVVLIGTTYPPPGCVSPVEIAHEVLDNGNVRLSWNPVQGAHNYRVRYRLDGSNTWTSLNAGSNTSVILENVGPGTYIAQIQTLCANSAGTLTESVWSQNYVFTVGAPPTDCPAPHFTWTYNDDGSIRLVINYNLPNPGGAYRICYRYSTTSEWTCFNAQTTSVNITLATGAQLVYVYLQAVCGDVLSEPSPVATIQIPNPPPPGCVSPVEIAHEVLDNGNVRLSWNPVQGAHNYRVRYRLDGSNTWTSLNAGPNTSVILENVGPGTYIAQVQTLCANSAGTLTESVWSQNYVFTVGAPPTCPPPTNVGHGYGFAGGTFVYWTAPADFHHFLVTYTSVDGQTYSFNVQGNEHWPPLPNGYYTVTITTLCANNTPGGTTPPYTLHIEGNGGGEPCPEFIAVFDENIPTVVCNNSAPIVLHATPEGGNYEGNGVILGDVVAWFDPAEAGMGTHVVTYTYSLSANCVYTTSIEITVVGSGENIEIHGLNPTYCHNPYIDPVLMLQGTPAGGWFELVYLSNVPEVPGVLSSDGMFFPWQLYPGEYAVIYHIDGECEGSATEYFAVLGAAATITGIHDGQTFCSASNATIMLVGQPAGGQFQGPGITGPTNPNGVAAFNPDGLQPGNYYLTYSGEANGCGYTETVTFTVAAPAPAQIGGLAPAYCPGAPTTQLWTTPVGGVFSISPTSSMANAITPNGVFSPSSLAPGTYTVHYHSAPGLTGCGFYTSATVVISGPMHIVPTLLHPTCNTCNDGSITVTVSGGTAPYQYSMQGLGMTVVSGSPIFNNLLPGTYSIVVTDAAGCSQTLTVTLGPQTNCPPPTGLHATQITGSSAHLTWNAVAGAQSYTVRYRRAGTNAWTQITVPGNSAMLQALAANAEYIVQVRSNCGNVTSNFGQVFTFVTSNVAPSMCVNPSPLMVQASYTTATVFWPPVPGASSYQLQFRRANNNLWTTVNVQAPITSFVINGLLPGTNYVVRIRTRCGNTVAPWSPGTPFTTLSGRAADEVKAETALVVYPNPNKGVFEVEYTTAVAGPTPVRLVDIAGRTVWSRVWELEAGTHALPVELDAAAGIYLLQVGQARPVRLAIE